MAQTFKSFFSSQLLVSVVAVVMHTYLGAQNYYDHWAFGVNVHIDFTSGTPIASCNTAINSFEAAAVWSNPATGSFIAYTDGATVYNGQTHLTLINGTGLTANASSIESALILPKPGASIDEFYIFHNNIFNAYWSEADISIGANGTVTSKNNFLQATGTERCGTAPHGSICPAYWVMISKNMNDSVAAYLIDVNGISPNPVVTPTGISGGSARGNIVFSEDFTKMGMSVENKGMYVCDFDNNTGQTSNWQKIGTTTNGFGSAFSPDGTKVYYTSGYGQNLYQYDFNNTTETYLGGTGLSYPALAPDGKIYVSKWGQQSLGVVNFPNAAGAACNFQISGFALSCNCQWGLPNPFHVQIGTNPSQPDTITLCTGEDTTYTTQITGDSIIWSTGDTTWSILMDSAGLYWAQSWNGDCTSSDSIYLQFVDDVTISGVDVCLDDSTYFSHSTAMPSANIVSYYWDFGDGTSSTQQNPAHLYQDDGTFTVAFTLETTTGCQLTDIIDVVVKPLPIVDFSFDNECDGDAVQFMDQSLGNGYTNISRYWDVTNNGTTEYQSSNPTHTYPAFGNYQVELKVQNILGCSDSLVKTVSVHANPVADFVVDNECLHVLHEFQDMSFVAQGNISSWFWSFGDGNSTGLQSPSHTYQTPGSKDVSLIVITDSGCVASITYVTEVYHLPVANFDVAPVCQNVTAEFVQGSTSQSGNISQYYWEFGDGKNAGSSSPVHDFPSAGVFPVTLGVLTSVGCVDTVVKNFRVYPIPTTGFGWENNVCEGEVLSLYDQSQIENITPGGDEIVSWNWEVNDEFFSDKQHPDYKTTTYETFKVTLRTTSNYGCSTKVSNFIQVFPVPDALFTFDMNCEKYLSQFRDESTVPVGIIDDWRWDFGDGGWSNVARPQYAYDAHGSFDVKLKVWTNKGCSDSITTTVRVPETPVPAFTINPDSGCADLHVQTVNLTTMSAGGLTHKWYSNGNLVSDLPSPEIVLTNDTLEPVKYWLRLVSTADNGCKAFAELEDSVIVLPKPTARFDYASDDFAIFDPSVEFYNISEQSTRWYWEFGDERTSTDFAPKHHYERHGEYQVDLTVWNTYNCPDSTYDFVWVDPITTMYIPNAFTPNGDGDNDTWKVYGFNSSNDFKMQVWDRWGHLVFESTDINFEWNGLLDNGKKAPIGVYIYKLRFVSSDNDMMGTEGSFSLIR